MDLPTFDKIKRQYNAFLLVKNKAVTPNPFDPIYEAITALKNNDIPPLTFLRQ